VAQVHGSPQGAALRWGKEPREVPRWTGTSHRQDIDGSPPCAIRRLAVIGPPPHRGRRHHVRCRARRATGRPLAWVRPDRTPNAGASSIRRQPRHVRHQPSAPGSPLSTHSGPRATAVCSGSAPVRDVASSSCPGGLPVTALGRRRGAVEAISAKARGWLTARVERGPTRPAHICYCRATGCPSSPRPGIEVTDLTVGRPAQPARRSDHAGPQPTVLPPGAPSAEET
jgi:hypothetical protein